MDSNSQLIAVIGGTGNQGFGLALRWALAGEWIVLGSRDAERASQASERLRGLAREAIVTSAVNEEAVLGAPLVVLTVPLAAQTATLKAIKPNLAQGAILIDTTVPLEAAVGGRISRILPLWDGSAAQQSARLLGPAARVVAAFHSLSADRLHDLSRPLDSDVLVCGDDRDARAVVAGLARKIPGVNPIDLGPLDNARYSEHLAATLIALNIRHKVKSSGVRFSGLSGGEDTA